MMIRPALYQVLRCAVRKFQQHAQPRQAPAAGRADAPDGETELARRPGKPRTADNVAIVLATLEPPPKRVGVTHWSSRLLAAELGVSNVKVAKVWRE